jgi:hypothetical protein
MRTRGRRSSVCAGTPIPFPSQQPALIAAAPARPSLPLTQLPLKWLSIETGCVLLKFEQPIKRAESIVVVEQFNQKLLIKQVCS